MDFAKKQLLKYGWTEGKGLGKNENGISEALKPKLKFDTTGIGHDSSEQFTFNWWENVYNNAAENININTGSDGKVSIDLNNESVNITTKKYSISVANKKKGLEYGTFLNTSKLTQEGVIEHVNKEAEVEGVVKVSILTDAELFKACGGRTAHKAARHGIKLSGKAARLARQEEELLEISKFETKCKKAIKKLKTTIKDHQKKKERLNNNIIPNLNQLTEQFTISEINNQSNPAIENQDDKTKVSVTIVTKSVVKPKKKNKMEDNVTENVKTKIKSKENDKTNNVETSENVNINEKTDENVKTVENLVEMCDEKGERKFKKKRKRKPHVQSAEELELEASRKRYEKYCEKKSRKKLKIKRRKEAKQFDKITEMFDNVSLDKEPLSEDDGFEEGVHTKKIKVSKDSNRSERKTKKKKKKCKKQNQVDDFDDLMTEIKDKLCQAVELRKEISHKKNKSDNHRIDKMSEKLNKCTFN